MSKQEKIEKNKKKKNLAKELGVDYKLIQKCKIYKAAASCGCCQIEMYFLSEENAKAAVERIGLTVSGIIIDDLGQRHEHVDTFYGLVRSQE